MYTRNAGEQPVYWQGPSVGFDWGADGDRTMMLVYNLPAMGAIYQRFGGVDGSAYFVGGFGFTALNAADVVVVPIRTESERGSGSTSATSNSPRARPGIRSEASSFSRRLTRRRRLSRAQWAPQEISCQKADLVLYLFSRPGRTPVSDRIQHQPPVARPGAVPRTSVRAAGGQGWLDIQMVLAVIFPEFLRRRLRGRHRTVGARQRLFGDPAGDREGFAFSRRTAVAEKPLAARARAGNALAVGAVGLAGTVR